LNHWLQEQEWQFATTIKQQNNKMECWKLESQTYTMPGPTWTLASGRDTMKHYMKVTLEYDNSDQITFPPFKSKLRAKLQMDRHIIGNKQEQV
jgi:hypothetical protein